MTTRVSNLKFFGNVMLGYDTRLLLTWLEPQKRTLGAFRQGDSVNILLKATGQNLTEDITYHVHVGSLPEGVTLNETTGRLTGITTDQEALVEFTIRAVSGAAYVDKEFWMVLGDHPSPVWVTPEGLLDLVDVNMPVADDFYLLAEDPYELEVSYLITGGQLPPGVFLDPQTGRLTGTYPDLEEDTEYEFTVSATNGDTGTQRSFSIYVQGVPPEGAPIWITPAGDVGEGYELSFFSTTLHAIDLEGDEITYVRVAGNIPDGLMLDPETGVLSGYLGAQPDNTQFKFIIGARAAPHNTKRMFIITVKHDPEPVFDFPGEPDDIWVFDSEFEQSAWSYALPVTTNPDLIVVFTAEGLPPEIDLDINTGVLSSTALPLVPAPREEDLIIEFTVTVSDGLKSKSKDFALTVLRDLPPVWQLPDDLLGEGYGETQFSSPVPLALDVYNRPVVYTLAPETPLPEGLDFDPNTGRIYGELPATPTEDITIPFTITAISGANPATQTFRVVAWYNIEPIWDVEEGLMGEMIEGYPSAFAAIAHDLHFVQPIQYLLTGGSLPPGLTLDEYSGAIIGTANSITDPDFTISNFTVQASYFGILPTERDFSIQVNKNYPPVWDTPPGPQIEVLALKTFSINMGGHDPNDTPVEYELVFTDIPLEDNQFLNVTATEVSGRFELLDNETTYLVRSSISDTVNMPVTRDFTIKVLPNLPPVWTTPADTVIIDAFETEEIFYQLEASDPEGIPIVYYVSIGNNDIIRQGPNVVSLTGNGAVQGRLPNVQEDTEYTFTAHAWDDTGSREGTRYRIVPRNFTIMVRFNSPPSWVSPMVRRLLEQTSVSIQLAANGAGNLPQMQYTLSGGSLPPGLSMSQTGLITGEPDAVEEDTEYEFTVTAFNGIKATDRTFTWTVEHNLEPVWNTPAGEIFSGLGQVPFVTAISGMDPNSPLGVMYMYLVDISELPNTVVFTPSTNPPDNAHSYITGLISGSLPLGEQDQEFNFTVALDDRIAPPVLRTFTLVDLANSDPIWNSPEGFLAKVREEKFTTIQVSASDPEGNAIVYTMANGTNLPGSLTLYANGSIRGETPNAVTDTDYPFSVRAADPDHEAYRDFYITVEHNYPPEWVTNAGLIGSVIGGYDFPGRVEAADPNADDILEYSLISGATPPGLSLRDDGFFEGAMELLQAQTTYTFSVEATDGVYTINRQFEIEGLVNRPPVFVPGGKLLGTQREGTNFSAHIDVFDPDGLPLEEQEVSGLPPELTFDTETGDLTGTIPVLGANGTVTFQYLANDGVLANTQTYTIGVIFDSPPTFTTSTLPDAVEAQPYSAMITASADGQQVFFSIASGSLPLGIQLYANGAIIGTAPSVDLNTDYVFEARAATLTKQSTRTFTLRVVKSEPPVWITNTNLTPGTLEGELRTYLLEASDVNGLPLVYTFQGGTLPLDWTFNPISNAMANPMIANVVGMGPPVANNTTYNFTIGASNGYIRTDRTFNLTILYDDPPVWVTAAGTVATQLESTNLTSVVLKADDPEGKTVTYQQNAVNYGWPMWLTLNANTGALSGMTPSVDSNTTVNFGVDASDGHRYSTREFAINVVPDTTRYDPHANAIVLLMHLDNDTKDYSRYPQRTALSAGGSFTTNSKFGTHAYDPSPNLPINMGYSTEFDLNIPEWTVEFWAYPTSAGTQRVMHDGGYTNNSSYVWWQFNITGGFWQFGAKFPSEQYLTLGNVVLNQWQHIAVSRDTNGTIRGFVNGVMAGSTLFGTIQPQSPSLPYGLWIAGDGMNGVYTTTLLDDVRITQKRRYNASFTPPVSSAPNPPFWLTSNSTPLVYGNEGNAISNVFVSGIALDDPYTNTVVGYTVVNSAVTGLTVSNAGQVQGVFPEGGRTYTFESSVIDGNNNLSAKRTFSVFSNAAATPNLIHSWRFNHAVGSQDLKATIGPMTLTPSSAPAIVHAAAPNHTGDTAITMTTNGFAYTNTGTNLSFMQSGPYTIEFWMYLTAPAPSGGNATPFSIGGQNIRLFHWTTAGDNLWHYQHGSGATSVLVNSPTIGAWNHMAFVYTGSTVRVYTNGVAGPSASVPAPVVNNLNMILNNYGISGGDSGYSYATARFKTFNIWNIERYTANFTPVWPGYEGQFDGGNAPVWVSPPAGSLGDIDANQIINQSLVATDAENRPVRYYLSAGTLPSGLSVSNVTVSNSGRITGTMPEVDEDTEYSFTVSATDGQKANARTFTYNVISVSDPDPFLANVVALAHLDGNLNNEGTNYSISPTGVSFSSVESKFGGTSILTDVVTNSNYLSLDIGTDTDFFVGAYNYTIEAWFYPLTNGGQLFRKGPASGTSGQIFTYNTAQGFAMSREGSSSSGTVTGPALNLNAWNHVAMVRNGTSVSFFKNGQGPYSAGGAGSYGPSSGASTLKRPLLIGFGFVGYIDEFRFTTAIRYTSAFLPPTRQFRNP